MSTTRTFRSGLDALRHYVPNYNHSFEGVDDELSHRRPDEDVPSALHDALVAFEKELRRVDEQLKHGQPTAPTPKPRKKRVIKKSA